MTRQKIYASDLEKREAMVKKEYLRSLPPKLVKARLRHLHVVRELRRAGMDDLFDDYEKGLV